MAQIYDKIIKYRVTVACREPLHIGSASGAPGEVLVHPVDEVPFIQASSLAGLCRACCAQMKGEDRADVLFGASLPEGEEGRSAVSFSDGTFRSRGEGAFRLEMRPRVAIDPVSGTVSESTIGGSSGRRGGHKFEMEYIAAGSQADFDVYLYQQALQEDLEAVFAAIDSGQVPLGGQKSNGCGSLQILSLLRYTFDMTKEEDRRLWLKEDSLPASVCRNITGDLRKAGKRSGYEPDAYEITVTAKTEGALLVKGIAVSDFGEGAADVVNVRNAAKDFIIPGSSVKGALRSRMELIAAYLEEHVWDVDSEAPGAGCGLTAGTVIADALGGDNPRQKGRKMAGSLYCRDTVVGDQESNSRMPLTHRIHLDKFTGGVIHGGLFSEQNVAGELTLKMTIRDRNHPDRTCGLLLMALRDLANGSMNLGSGFSIGKGFLTVSSICVEDRKKSRSAVLDFGSGKIRDEGGLIADCMKALTGAETQG